MAYCMPCPAEIMSKMIPKINTMEKRNFIRPRIHSQKIEFSVLSIKHPFCNRCRDIINDSKLRSAPLSYSNNYYVSDVK